MRDLFDGWHRGTAEHELARYAEAVGAPLPATWCRADGASPRTVVVYAHGGGFVVDSRDSHRKLCGHLAARSGIPALVVDYRRAPEHPFPAAIDDVVATARWLIDQGCSAEHIAFAGDSAGGNIAVNAALRMIRDGAAPGAVVTLSPWIDLANTGSSLDENAAHDAMVDRSTLELMTGLYLAGESPVAPHVNPLHADRSLGIPTALPDRQPARDSARRRRTPRRPGPGTRRLRRP
jgi:acetyl esterase/lipase